MKHFISIFAAAVMLVACTSDVQVVKNTLRAPAYPLVTIDPFTSAWSAADRLFDAPVTHWTGAEHNLIGILTVDGVPYRFLGKESPRNRFIARASDQTGWPASYMLSRPSGSWMERDYDDSSWIFGEGAFGSPSRRPMIHTDWEGPQVWVRREVQLDESFAGRDMYLYLTANEYATVYVNGIAVVDDTKKYSGEYIRLADDVTASLVSGKNVIAAVVTNPRGSAQFDVALVEKLPIQMRQEMTAEQLYADVQPMQTRYGFTCGPVELSVSFLAPLFLDDLDLVSRPVNYISYEVSSLDGVKHDVKISLEASPAWAVNFYGNEETLSQTFSSNGLLYLKASSVDQNILGKKGDDDRINWGSFYLVAEESDTQALVSEEGDMAFVRDLGSSRKAEGKFMIGYDDLYSVQYFGENLRPYWNRTGDVTIESQFEVALKDYRRLSERASEFDLKLMTEAVQAGGQKYADLCALAYRQAISAHKLVVAPEGFLMFLSKENNSNGSIGTVDITYPSLPIFLKYNTELARALMNHIFHYSESGRWTKPFPAHDVGTYPLANGQTYPEDMPVEEAGNMLIGAAAVCFFEDSPAYAREHWDVMTIWADYLSQFGLDPENQLCTDDFAGHLAHNANLSVKAILGIASYARMADMLGEKEASEKYMALALSLADEWEKMADDGDHYRLTFDRPDTWSQKYNLVWDSLLGLNVFPQEIMKKDYAYYKTKVNEWGLPLDSRSTYTKSDWIIWTASMARSREDFNALVDPLWKFYNETIDRVPMSDWFYTDKPEFCMFIARSVVGGYFMPLL